MQKIISVAKLESWIRLLDLLDMERQLKRPLFPFSCLSMKFFIFKALIGLLL